MGPHTSSSCGPAPAFWTPEDQQGRAEGPRVEGAARLGGGEELLAMASLRCWSKGTGGGEGRTGKVLLRGMGEPGGKTTWGEGRKETDEDGGNISSASRGRERRHPQASPGPSHSDPPCPPATHTTSSLLARAGEGLGGQQPCCGPSPGHLPTTFSTSCPSARLPRGCTVMTTPSVIQSSVEAPPAPAASSASGWMPSRPCSSAMSRSWEGVLLRVAGSSRRRGEGSRDMGCAWPVSRLLLITERI